MHESNKNVANSDLSIFLPVAYSAPNKHICLNRRRRGVEHSNNGEKTNVPPESNERKNAKKSRSPTSRSKSRVLIADDNPTDLKMLQMWAQQLGFPMVDLASNCVEAIHAIASQDYDIALLAAEISGVSGFVLSQAIRYQCKKRKSTESLVITNAGAPIFHYEKEAALHGVDHALYKPLSKNELHRLFHENSFI